jgi:hypothetical protein
MEGMQVSHPCKARIKKQCPCMLNLQETKEPATSVGFLIAKD